MPETPSVNPFDANYQPNQAAEVMRHQHFMPHELTSQDMIRNNERNSVTVDAYHIGQLATASTLKAAMAVGSPYKPELTTPYTEKDLKPWRAFKDEGFGFQKVVPEQKIAQVGYLNERLNDITALTPAEIEGFTLDAGKGFEKAFVGLNWMYGLGNVDFTFDNLAVPTFLRDAKELSGADHWKVWLKDAPQAQKENFAQWYTAELTALATPEARTAKIDALKGAYKDKVTAAMEEGWIDSKHQRHLDKTMRKVKLSFFSPFSSTAQEFGGVNISSMFTKNSIVLPIGVGEHISDHEFGHTFAGIDQKGLAKELFTGRPKDDIPSSAEKEAFGYLFTALNEGFNDHMTGALKYGKAGIINPAVRAEQGVEIPDASEGYTLCRELFGALVAGPDANGVVSDEEFKHVNSFLIEQDMPGFSDYVSRKWGNRPVIKELYDVLHEHYQASQPDLTDKVVIGKMMNRLAGEKLAAEPRTPALV